MNTPSSPSASSLAPLPDPGTRCLITGPTGQDGYYLARILAEGGCTVLGLVCPGEEPRLAALADWMGPWRAADLRDPEATGRALDELAPDIIYHLAAQSSVGFSWEAPRLTAEVNALGTIHLLDWVRAHPEAALLMAGTCDGFDHAAAGPAGLTPHAPFLATNPYSASKVMAHQMARCYRERFDLHVSVAVLLNHTSPRRPPQFVERSIINQAVAVAEGRAEAVTVGNPETRRDWSWAPEIMEAFARMAALPAPTELVLGSGRLARVGDWVEAAFGYLGLDPAHHLRLDPALAHSGGRPHREGDIGPACDLLGWEPRVTLDEMARQIIEAERRRAATAEN